ncbi:MAG: rRNA pseudouridine synthase [Rhodospirillales bacterium]|nr:rRNA pseudouridine synthase [Rhodospirillales bacterium]MCB9965743.1 rRNA pseudouridine synthase [Rhodospirillales bacterium]MCB9979671.1 rRNA pseudouridine synthase [Rhodospirillales bacterium]
MSAEKERIAKYLARAGVASRRAVEAMIAEGRIVLNGQKLETPATLVDGSEDIRVDGKPVQVKDKTRLFLFHKPAGLVTSHKDEKDRETVFDYLKSHYPDLPRLISVGRLDLTTEGLLLLTNDGALSRYMELPQTGWTRSYRVRVFGLWNDKKAARLQKGMQVDGVRYAPIKATFERQTGDNIWLNVSLQEGKNREIRKVMEALELQVNRLIRVSYGPFLLNKLEKGAVIEVPEKQLKSSVPQDRLSL